MASIDPMSTLSPVSAGTGQKDTPEKILNAARQFESLLVEQILRTMRESAQAGWMGSGDDKSSESLMEFAEQEFAKVMSAGGGFGLARMIADGLRSSSTQQSR